MTTRKAYSYIRFSCAEQQKGDSLRRQSAARDAFLVRHNAKQHEIENSGQEPDYLQLDDRILDLGKSGYKGEHLAEGGALALFLERVRAKEIPRGSVLIVEHLDRLGRMEVIEQLELFLGILRAGVEVVTLTDGMWYSRERARSDQTALIISIIKMNQAFDESDKKATRLAAVWENKRAKITTSKTPATSICPGWIHLNRETGNYEEIKERVTLVREIFARILKGEGKRTIAMDFNRRKIQTWGVKGKAGIGWHDSYIQKIIRNDAVIGIFHPHSTRTVVGKRVPVGSPVENFYPSVIDLKTWKAVQALRKGVAGRRSGRTNSLFTGLVKDGLHGVPMHFIDKGVSKTARWQYLVSDRRRTNPEEYAMRWRYEDFEELFLRSMLDYDWQKQNENDPVVIELENQVITNDRHLLELKQQGQNLAKAIAQGVDATFLRDEIQEIEGQISIVQNVLAESSEKLRSHKQAIQSQLPIENAEQIFANRHQEETRLRLRLEIRQRVNRIDMFPDGTANAFSQPELPEPYDLHVQATRCFMVTLTNGGRVWVLGFPNKIVVIEQPPQSQQPTFWQTTRHELKGYEFWRGLTNKGVDDLLANS